MKVYAKCPCGRRVLIRKDGNIPKHLPAWSWQSIDFCPYSSTPPFPMEIEKAEQSK